MVTGGVIILFMKLFSFIVSFGAVWAVKEADFLLGWELRVIIWGA